MSFKTLNSVPKTQKNRACGAGKIEFFSGFRRFRGPPARNAEFSLQAEISENV
jgi:hypothetical protein